MSERVLGQPGNCWVHRGCWLEAREGEKVTTQVKRPWVEDREENRVWRKGCTGLKMDCEIDWKWIPFLKKTKIDCKEELDQTVCSPF